MSTQAESDGFSNRSMLPSIFRFLVELTTWGYFIWLAFTVNILYIIGFIFSLALLATFNFPGDKVKEGPVNVSGPARILVEITSGMLGVYGAFMIFGQLGMFFQAGLTIFAYILDTSRWSWMLGKRSDPPESVLRNQRNRPTQL